MSFCSNIKYHIINVQVFARIKLFSHCVCVFFSFCVCFRSRFFILFSFIFCLSSYAMMDAIRAVSFFVRCNKHYLIFFFPPFTFIRSMSRGPNEQFPNRFKLFFFVVITFFIDLESSNFIFRIYSIEANISHTAKR